MSHPFIDDEIQSSSKQVETSCRSRPPRALRRPVSGRTHISAISLTRGRRPAQSHSIIRKTPGERIQQQAVQPERRRKSCNTRLRLKRSLSSNRPRSLSAKRSLERLLDRLLTSLSLLRLRLTLALQLTLVKPPSDTACFVNECTLPGPGSGPVSISGP